MEGEIMKMIRGLFFACHFLKPLKLVSGLPKWTIFTGKKHISCREKIRKSDFVKHSSYAAGCMFYIISYVLSLVKSCSEIRGAWFCKTNVPSRSIQISVNIQALMFGIQICNRNMNANLWNIIFMEDVSQLCIQSLNFVMSNYEVNYAVMQADLGHPQAEFVLKRKAFFHHFLACMVSFFHAQFRF